MRILTYLMMLAFLLVACKKEHTFYGHLYDAPAYDFELTSQNGKRVKLSDYLGEKKNSATVFWLYLLSGCMPYRPYHYGGGYEKPE
jgi:cytochrome oxidase Cu insertion factor (SCO1/SenC/PrrC family)